MTRNEKICIEELNNWYKNKSWPKRISYGNTGIKGIPFTSYDWGESNRRVHCYDGIMLSLIGLDYKHIIDKGEIDKYRIYMLEIMDPMLKKYDVTEMSIGDNKYKWTGSVWIKETD